MVKIMIVEDDPMISEIYKTRFESAGFDVALVGNGKEVLKLAAKEKFDLILLDMVLPEISGMDVLKELKKSGKYSSDMRVIVLSNLEKSEIEKEACENGADGFIEKANYNASELVDHVKRLANEFAEQKKNRERLSGNAETVKKGKKILFIEDEEIFLEMFGKKLEDEGYDVDYAKNGAWGSKMAAENRYDLIITDAVMPAAGGDEIVRRIKLDDKTKDIPIIVLSASLDNMEAKMLKELGVNEFFEKTRIVPSDLARKVEEILK